MAVITLAKLADLRGLIALESEIFESERISARQFRYLVTKANSVVVKVENEGKMLGYMILLKRKKSSRLRIYSIGVAGFSRKSGVATDLLLYAEYQARLLSLTLLTLEVCEHNYPAMQLYSRVGFSLYGKRKEYYEDGCTALLLRKKVALSA